ncbi:MAG TPA: YihY/virulence factor BrkB family protein [Acidimicrobiales bacterium]|nr:YihY/virulence factor BrkB family protein [Acidimicrobiales bacterium]
MAPQKLLERLDRFQRGHRFTGMAVAVFKKFGDDEAGKHAALIAYYGFFSLFPLLLLFVTLLGFFLGGHSRFEESVVHSILGRFPVIGQQLRVHSLKGSGLALVVGIVGSLWGGMGVVQAAQSAMDTVWGVPRKKRPNFVSSRLRAVVLLLVLGVGVIVSTVLAGIATGGSHAWPFKVTGLVVSVLVNGALYLAAFRLLTVAHVRWRQLVPGAVLAAIAGAGLQAIGGYYVGHQLDGASQTYGLFAMVIGLLSWLYLQAQVTLLAAEVNVVLACKLWPRSLVGDDTTADEKTLTALAEMEERRPDEDVRVSFTDDRRAG